MVAAPPADTSIFDRMLTERGAAGPTSKTRGTLFSQIEIVPEGGGRDSLPCRGNYRTAFERLFRDAPHEVSFTGS